MSDRPVPDRNLPTVVVARRPRPGRERDFERWLRRLIAAANRAPGHISSELQPPDGLHPGEWMIVYQFADAEHLERWITSPGRRALMAEGADLIEGEEREQVLAVVPDHDSDPVTAVVSFSVAPDRLGDFDDLYAVLVQQMQTFPGFLRCERFEPVPGVQDESVVVFSFASRPDLDRWLRSDERGETLRRIDPLIEAGRTVNVVGGFGGWFGGGRTTPVKRWKQAATVLLALYPLALVLGVLRSELIPDAPLVPAVLISNIVAVALLTWVLMPWVTRLLAGWLNR